jgi:hypothetical protein
MLLAVGYFKLERSSPDNDLEVSVYLKILCVR